MPFTETKDAYVYDPEGKLKLPPGPKAWLNPKAVKVFNFKTMKYEQANEAEAEDFVGLIESMTADCAAAHKKKVRRVIKPSK